MRIAVPFHTSPSFSCKVDNWTLTDKHDSCLCSATNIGLARHNLTITNMANSPLFLDSFYVFQPVFGSPARNQSTSSSSTIPTMTSSLLQSIYNQPFRPNPTTSSSITVSSPTAVEFTAAPSRNVQLIGGAVGGLALLIIVVILGAWFVKRRRNANRWKAPSSHFSSSSIKNPY